MRYSCDRHGMLLHGFQQCGLSLRSRAVDFIRQQDVGKQGPSLEFEHFATVRRLRNDLSPDEVSRHEVGRELDATELEMQRVGESPHGERLAESGDSFQQYMSAGNQGNQSVVQDFLLSDDDLGYLTL